MPEPTVTIRLWRADALVLFDWLMQVDLHRIPTTHPAQRQALMDLLTQLDVTDAAHATADELADARTEVARDIGW